MKKLRVGTRPSKLAITQTTIVINALSQHLPGVEIETVVIRTSGDLKQDISNPVVRDKRDWIQELETAILEDRIDLAVHSGKDVPYDISNVTKIASVLERADVRDIFIGKRQGAKRLRFSDLPMGATIGTASLRRRAQLLLLRPDLEIIDLRGNVTTRVAKLDGDSKFSGIILAAAGLERLGISLESMELLSTENMLPASAQGILTVQYQKKRAEIAELLIKLRSMATEAELLAERAAIRCLGADCASAVAVFAKISDTNLKICGRVFSRSSPEFIEAEASGLMSESELLGTQVGEALLAQGAKRLLSEQIIGI